MLGEIGQQSLISNLSDAIVGHLWPSSRSPHLDAGEIGVRVLEAVTSGKGHTPDLAALPIA
jgi:hypothetical protein